MAGERWVITEPDDGPLCVNGPRLGGERRVEVERAEPGRTMQYEEIERLAAAAEAGGGYAHVGGPEGDYFGVIIDGEEQRVGPGRDCLTFLQILLRRSQAREAELKGIEGYDGAAVEQARRDARNEVLAAVNAALSRIAFR